MQKVVVFNLKNDIDGIVGNEFQEKRNAERKMM